MRAKTLWWKHIGREKVLFRRLKMEEGAARQRIWGACRSWKRKGNGASPGTSLGLGLGCGHLWAGAFSAYWTPLHSSPRPVITNDHRLGGLKQQKIIPSEFWGEKSHVQAPALPHFLQRLLGTVLPCFLQLLCLLMLFGRWQRNSSLCFHLQAFSLSLLHVCVSSSYRDTSR